MPTVQELLAQKEKISQQLADIDAQIDSANSEARKAAISEVQAKVAEFGLSAQEVFNTKTRAVASSNKKSRGKAVVKYRDGQTGNSWTGRGIKPRWLTAALASGKKIEDFAV